jgi:hypothetical protein
MNEMKKNIEKSLKIAAILLIAMMLLSFGACSGSGEDTAASDPIETVEAKPFDPGTDLYNGDEPEAISVDETPMAMEDIGDAEAPLLDSDEEVVPESAAQDTAGAGGEDAGFTDENDVSDVQTGRKITFSASYSINTKSYDADYKKINDMITQAGGYVSNEETSDYTGVRANEGRYTHLSARVPAKGYDSFLDSLSSVGEVMTKNKSSQDLTTEYFDTEARIQMLELRKERLMNYLVLATDAAEIIEFERELSSVLYELDQYQGNKRKIDQFVEFATVDVTLTELITPETIGKDGQPLGDRANDAFKMSKNNVNTFLENAAVFFAGAAPVIGLIALIIVIVLVIVKVVRTLNMKYRKRFPKKEKAPKPMTPQQIYQQQMYQYQAYQAQQAAQAEQVAEKEQTAEQVEPMPETAHDEPAQEISEPTSEPEIETEMQNTPEKSQSEK